MRRTVPPSAEIEAQIDQLLAVGVGENPRESLSELAKLGARLIIQRAVEDEFDMHRLQALADDLDNGGYAAAANASPMTWTHSSCTCATRRDIAAAGGQQICSSAPSARSNAGRR